MSSLEQFVGIKLLRLFDSAHRRIAAHPFLTLSPFGDGIPRSSRQLSSCVNAGRDGPFLHTSKATRKRLTSGFIV
jgi:hypothetical protein